MPEVEVEVEVEIEVDFESFRVTTVFADIQTGREMRSPWLWHF